MKKLRIRIAKALDPDLKIGITSPERSVIQAALTLMQCPDTSLLVHPTKEKFYIKSADDQLTIIGTVYPASVILANHKFREDIPFSKRAMNFLHNQFINFAEERRENLEKMVLENTELALKKVCEMAKAIVNKE